MRRHLSFSCEGAELAATLDDAPGTAGLLIVSGGNEVRSGAHRGLAMLAAALAAAGFPVLRFDRRGIGDSGGSNGGFRSSEPDIIAALAAFRKAAPGVTRIAAFGNCDAATALALLPESGGLDALILSNPWVIETPGDTPTPQAVRARYRRKLADPAALIDLLRGRVDLKKLGRGLAIAGKGTALGPLARDMAQGLAGFAGRVHILAASRDATSSAFMGAWESEMFKALRASPAVKLHRIDSGSHSYAGEAEQQWLRERVLAVLAALAD